MNLKFVHFLRFLTRQTYSITNEKRFIFKVGEISSSNATQAPHFFGPTSTLIVNERYGPIIQFPTLLCHSSNSPFGHTQDSQIDVTPLYVADLAL
jgi:hypothetical protein